MTSQPNLLSYRPQATSARFDGAAYSPGDDDKRLTEQLGRVRSLMADGAWRTLAEISTATGDPQASVSAQLRHLRKDRFGRHAVEKRRRGDTKRGLFEYRVGAPGTAETKAPRVSLEARVRQLEATVQALVGGSR